MYCNTSWFRPSDPPSHKEILIEATHRPQLSSLAPAMAHGSAVEGSGFWGPPMSACLSIGDLQFSAGKPGEAGEDQQKLTMH